METGGVELAAELYSKGYDRIRQTYPEADAANQAMISDEASVEAPA